MIEKNGELTENSQSDFDTTKKAEYIDGDGFCVADEANKSKLKDPQPINKCGCQNKKISREEVNAAVARIKKMNDQK